MNTYTYHISKVPVTFSKKIMKVDDFNIANNAVVAGPWKIKLIIITKI